MHSRFRRWHKIRGPGNARYARMEDNPALSKGVQIATLVGGPSGRGRRPTHQVSTQLPDAPAYSPTYSEVVTVIISGAVGTVAHGEKFEKEGRTLEAGRTVGLPRKTRALRLDRQARNGYFKVQFTGPLAASTTSTRLTIRANSSRSHCKTPSQADTCLSVGIRKEDAMRSFQSGECCTCPVHGLVIVWLQRFGRAESGCGSGDVGMGAGYWRRRSRKGVTVLFRTMLCSGARCRRPCALRPGGATRLFRGPPSKVLPGLKVAFGDADPACTGMRRSIPATTTRSHM